VIAFRDYARQADSDQDFCERIWALGGESWRGAERVWRQLIGRLLDDIDGVESRDERRREAIKLAKALVLPNAG
jgi:hypothetical protein